MRAASDELAGERVVFPRRFITREADVHEDHMPISRTAFREAEAAGAFALSWEAHGLSYGIPREIDDFLGEGLTVVLNVSRAIVPQLRARYANLVIAAVSVDPKRLAQRLSARGRETQAEIALRIVRAQRDMPTGADVVVIRNDGPLHAAVRLFIAIVAGAAGPMDLYVDPSANGVGDGDGSATADILTDA